MTRFTIAVILALAYVTSVYAQVDSLKWDRIIPMRDANGKSLASAFAIDQLNDSLAFISNFENGQIYIVSIKTGEIVRTLVGDPVVIDSIVNKHGSDLLGNDFELIDVERKPPAYKIARRNDRGGIDIVSDVFVQHRRLKDNMMIMAPCVSIVSYDSNLIQIKSVVYLRHEINMQPNSWMFMPNEDGWYVEVMDLLKHKAKAIDSLPILQHFTLDGNTSGKVLYLNKQQAAAHSSNRYFSVPVYIDGLAIVSTSQGSPSIQYATQVPGISLSQDLQSMVLYNGISAGEIKFTSSPVRVDNKTIRLSLQIRENDITAVYYLHLTFDGSQWNLARCFKNMSEYNAGAEFVFNSEIDNGMTVGTILYKRDSGYYLGFKSITE